MKKTIIAMMLAAVMAVVGLVAFAQKGDPVVEALHVEDCAGRVVHRNDLPSAFLDIYNERCIVVHARLADSNKEDNPDYWYVWGDFPRY